MVSEVVVWGIQLSRDIIIGASWDDVPPLGARQGPSECMLGRSPAAGRQARAHLISVSHTGRLRPTGEVVS